MHVQTVNGTEFSSVQECYPQLEEQQKLLPADEFEKTMTKFIGQITEKREYFKERMDGTLAAAFQFGKKIIIYYGQHH